MLDSSGYALLCAVLVLMLMITMVIATSLIGTIGRRVERHGLASLLWGREPPVLQQPLVDTLQSALQWVTSLACDLVRLAMLMFLSLDDEQKQEVLDGMDPAFHRTLFQRPAAQLLPYPAQRLLLGRAASATVAGSPDAVRKGARSTSAPDLRARSASDGIVRRQSSLSAAEMCHVLRCTQAASGFLQGGRRRRTPDAVALEGILVHRARVSALSAVRTLATTTTSIGYENLVGGVACGRRAVGELAAGVRDLAADPTARAVAASAAGGAVALGTTGAAAGFLTGGFLGAAAGVVPAIFTFGLSIPICAAMGAGAGCCAGGAVGGSAGLACGGAIGLQACRMQEPDPGDTTPQSSLAEDSIVLDGASPSRAAAALAGGQSSTRSSLTAADAHTSASQSSTRSSLTEVSIVLDGGLESSVGGGDGEELPQRCASYGGPFC